jgi:AcrR family transcriptional regulator
MSRPASEEPGAPPGGSTGDKLAAAAACEFNEQGFAGTDTNKIARRAGFAPQTFYRWFEDKIAVFIRVYKDWQHQELEIVRRLAAEGASDERLVEACVAHHRAHLLFRRSLRQLACENDRVRAARAASRLCQVEYMKEHRAAAPDAARLAVMLLQIERLSDALAEGELGDMGMDAAAAEAALAQLIHELRCPADDAPER